jgi:glycerate kinase
MKVLIAPNALKGTLTAIEAGAIIQEFFQNEFPEIETQFVPIADGGDGTCFLLGEYQNLPQVKTWSLDPVGRSKLGFFYFDEENKAALIDVSTVSGLGDLEEELKSPYHTSSFGTGILIKKAIEHGASEIVLGLGGSATVDLGLGILQGLGFSFLNQSGKDINPFSDSLMEDLSHIQLAVPFPNIKFRLLCDVKNPFFGTNGAIPVFGPQKGLKESKFKTYETSARNAVLKLFSKARKDFNDEEGFGAAGGIAVGLSAFFPIEIEFGAPYFFRKVKLEESIKKSDLIITAEGRYDEQSKEGKACYELLQLANNLKKKTVLISSGEGGKLAGFDQFIQLPDLNFEKADFKEQAVFGLKKCLEIMTIK